MQKHFRWILASLVLTPAFTAATLSAEQDKQITALQEVIVTAQKKQQSLQETPVAISVLNTSQLEALGIAGLDGLINGVVPSLRINPNGNTATTLAITIRGNGSADSVQATRDGSVAIYQDGIYLGRTQGLSMEISDLERIEVLRGPQGTLFGRNAAGGAISLISKKPGGEFGIQQTVGLGSFDAIRSVTHLNLPSVAGVSAKIDYLHNQHDGWVNNTAAGQADYNESERQGGRISLNWQPIDPLSVDYSYDQARLESSQLYFQLQQDTIGIIGVERNRQTTTRFPVTPLERTTSDIKAHALISSWLLSDQLTLKSLSSYRELEEQSNNNYAGVLYSNGLIVAEDTEQEQWSQEFQVLGHYEQLDWVAGIYYFNEDIKQDVQFLFSLDIANAILNNTGLPFALIDPPMGLPVTSINAEAESLAFYGQATQTWAERLHLTIGARYTEDKKSGDRFQVNRQPFDLNTEHLDSSIALSYDWRESLTTYLKWASAYTAGGINIRSTNFQPFDQQVVKTWELGLKSEFLAQRIRINAALFSSDYQDMQFDFVDPIDATIIETLNARKTVNVSGFELELTAIPLNNVVVGVNYTYLDDDMPLQPNPLANNALQFFEIIQTPRHAGSLTFDYSIAKLSVGSLSAHLDITSTDGYAHSSVADSNQDSYTLINARLTLADIVVAHRAATLKISAWGKNLSDEEYAQLNFTIGNPMVTTIRAFGTPRSVGIDFTFDF